MTSRARLLLLMTCALAGGACIYSARLQACSNDAQKVIGTEFYFPLAYGDRPSKDQLATLGRKIFMDPSLSASGAMSCASCHSPDHAYGSPNGLMTQAGGKDMHRTGFRNAPSLRYLHSPIEFTEHFYELEVTGGQEDQGPTGGRTWDGRVNTGHDQALMPLLDANEMANKDALEIANRVRKASYAEEFRQAFSAPGQNVFDNPDAVLGWLSVAIEMFEQTPSEFHPFTSKYDAYLRDQVDLSPQEKRGLSLFNDIKKGNCASCHPGRMRNPSNSFPIFSDFGYAALGVPRNKDIAANQDPNFYDLGLCGPLRADLKSKTEYCGRFRAPSLRNVALRHSYFHNGVFHSLKQVLDFYVTRDITPQKWYAKAADGQVIKFDDLPPAYRKNVTTDPPFAPLPGNKPRLTPAEMDDVIAFLKTLSDGYTVPNTGPKRPRDTGSRHVVYSQQAGALEARR